MSRGSCAWRTTINNGQQPPGCVARPPQGAPAGGVGTREGGSLKSEVRSHMLVRCKVTWGSRQPIEWRHETWTLNLGCRQWQWVGVAHIWQWVGVASYECFGHTAAWPELLRCQREQRPELGTSSLFCQHKCVHCSQSCVFPVSICN